MIAVYRKELNHFFNSLIGYIAVGVFLLLIGLIVWVFPNNTLDNGYASYEVFFDNAPWVFLLLIPSITMRSFAEEFRSGTIELLSTSPVSEMKLIAGKFFASVTLVVIALIPTLIYYYTIYELGSPTGNLDSGAIIGSYIGLVFVSAVFSAIGIFCSSLTSNQIIAFLFAALLCFLFFMGFDSISNLTLFSGSTNDFIQNIGINAHYESISRGVVDTRDAIYFLALIFLFLLLTKTSLDSRKW
jgi:ABC-2 type transport system permease protein